MSWEWIYTILGRFDDAELFPLIAVLIVEAASAILELAIAAVLSAPVADLRNARREVPDLRTSLDSVIIITSTRMSCRRLKTWKTMSNGTLAEPKNSLEINVVICHPQRSVSPLFSN